MFVMAFMTLMAHFGAMVFHMVIVMIVVHIIVDLLTLMIHRVMTIRSGDVTPLALPALHHINLFGLRRHDIFGQRLNLIVLRISRSEFGHVDCTLVMLDHARRSETSHQGW